MNWIKKIFKSEEQEPAVTDTFEDFFEESVCEESTVVFMTTDKHGLIDDDYHYTDSVEVIKQLKSEGKYTEAIDILIKAVDATERESRKFGQGWGVAPWYYEQLAIIYRKEKLYSEEVAILERYQSKQKTSGNGEDKLRSRLDKARQSLEKSNA